MGTISKNNKEYSYSFSLRDICGTWISYNGSPTIEIYQNRNLNYWVQLTYKSGNNFKMPLKRIWGMTFFYLWGFFKVAYDKEKDTLHLSIEGVYYRFLE